MNENIGVGKTWSQDVLLYNIKNLEKEEKDFSLLYITYLLNTIYNKYKSIQPVYIYFICSQKKEKDICNDYNKSYKKNVHKNHEKNSLVYYTPSSIMEQYFPDIFHDVYFLCAHYTILNKEITEKNHIDYIKYSKEKQKYNEKKETFYFIFTFFMEPHFIWEELNIPIFHEKGYVECIFDSVNNLIKLKNIFNPLHDLRQNTYDKTLIQYIFNMNKKRKKKNYKCSNDNHINVDTNYYNHHYNLLETGNKDNIKKKNNIYNNNSNNNDIMNEYHLTYSNIKKKGNHMNTYHYDDNIEYANIFSSFNNINNNSDNDLCCYNYHIKKEGINDHVPRVHLLPFFISSNYLYKNNKICKTRVISFNEKDIYFKNDESQNIPKDMVLYIRSKLSNKLKNIENDVIKKEKQHVKRLLIKNKRKRIKKYSKGEILKPRKDLYKIYNHSIDQTKKENINQYIINENNNSNNNNKKKNNNKNNMGPYIQHNNIKSILNFIQNNPHDNLQDVQLQKLLLKYYKNYLKCDYKENVYISNDDFMKTLSLIQNNYKFIYKDNNQLHNTLIDPWQIGIGENNLRLMNKLFSQRI
ncbi:conserved Plasmodium protein, unknown function [Plasmodium sp. gorilla clade G3]|nr:conserved Plasmodium protein, unknown function [Plasmodium sp. gorilla clade G3]